MEEDDVPQLSADTFSALQEFYKEQEGKDEILRELNSSIDIVENGLTTAKEYNSISEDWQLSQFWYDDKTALDLANEVIRIAEAKGKFSSIACVSCPTLFIAIRQQFPATQYKGTIISPYINVCLVLIIVTIGLAKTTA